MNMFLKGSIALLSFFLVGVFTLQVLAAVPNQISNQGKLTDNLGTPLPNANYALTFRIFDAVSGGTLLWAEDQTVTVAGGIYNVILGEGSTTTGSFDHILFSDDNRWLEVVVAGEVLLPRQRVTSVAYALQAEEASLADDAETLAGYLPGDFSFTGHTHIVNWAEVASIPSGFADNTDDGITTESDPTVPAAIKDGISWAEVASKPSGFADNTDDVGITNEMDPTVLQSVKDGVSWNEIYGMPTGFSDGVDDIGGTTGRELIIDAVGIHDWTLSSTGDFQTQTGYFFIKDKTTDTLRFTIDQNSGLVSTGNLNITGTTKINIGGGSFDFTTPGGWPGIIGLAPNGYRREITMKNDFMWILAGDSASAPDATHGITIRNNGNVGIGTATPSDKLHVLGDLNVQGGDLKVQGNDGWNSAGDKAIVSLGSVTEQFYMKAVWGDGLKFGAYAAGDALVLKQGSGNVGIGTSNPSRKLTVRGNIMLENAAGTPIAEIGEGLDYAEGFNVTDYKRVNPGSVMRIDPHNPGNLMLSSESYDKRVAGIIAGAKGLGSGVRLGAGQFDYDVALAGRVYCNVDTAYGEIIPGDLLTTSATPGHAMMVKDYQRAHGAILGKAMEGLKANRKGQILVLVTLQ